MQSPVDSNSLGYLLYRLHIPVLPILANTTDFQLGLL